MLLSDAIKKRASKRKQAAAISDKLDMDTHGPRCGLCGHPWSKHGNGCIIRLQGERATMSDANAIASAIKAKMGEHRTEYYGNTPVHIDRDPDVNVFSERGGIRINVGYDTGEDETESYDVDEWVRKLKPVLAPYMDRIKRTHTEAEEKGYISTDIYLK